MQQALTRSVRMNKLVAGSVAALGASAIAVTPVATSPALIEAQHRAVQLVADITDAPATVYGDLFNTTIANATALQNNWLANPFPLLSMLAENQEGYSQKISDAVQSIPTSLQNWYTNGKGESKPGAEYLANYQAAIAAGDYNAAGDNLNRFMLFGIQNLTAPLSSVFLTTTPRGSTTPIPGLPQQMAQNFADAVGAFFSTTTIQGGIFQAMFAPASGASWELSRATGAISAALAAGDMTAALNAVINTPAMVMNAVVNGFDYDDGDTVAPWAGLLTGCIGKTGRCASGALEQLMITIPTRIATAIDNTPAVAPTSTASKLVSETKAIEADTKAITTGDDVSGATAVKEETAAKLVNSVSPTPAAATEVATEAVSTDTKVTETKVAETKVADTTATKAAGDKGTDAKKPGTRLGSAVKKLGDKLTSKKTDAGKTDAAKSDAAKSDTAKSDAAKPAKKDSTKTKAKKNKKDSGSDS